MEYDQPLTFHELNKRKRAIRQVEREQNFKYNNVKRWRANGKISIPIDKNLIYKIENVYNKYGKHYKLSVNAKNFEILLQARNGKEATLHIVKNGI